MEIIISKRSAGKKLSITKCLNYPIQMVAKRKLNFPTTCPLILKKTKSRLVWWLSISLIQFLFKSQKAILNCWLRTTRHMPDEKWCFINYVPYVAMVMFLSFFFFQYNWAQPWTTSIAQCIARRKTYTLFTEKRLYTQWIKQLKTKEKLGLPGREDGRWVIIWWIPARLGKKCRPPADDRRFC